MLENVGYRSDKFIKLSTSFDELHPPDNVLQDENSSFWITTGLFPQLLVVSLVEPSKIGRIRIVSSCIKNIWIEVSSQTEPEEFEVKSELTLAYSDGHQQITEVPMNETNMRHLRLNIRSGYDHFVAVYRVILEKS
ncbi:hypothetical protein EG68_11585 [Paragonimus skrjabini miyazakii]|uniref:Intraflagellar transport protein 25 homolog n=1 Tax=Paragonimus skrjabini miyazakii TaxID=59628 RepID=A0A8S9YHP7_9TREM|nr:hypothetical protein EG68_11585 [Paragonimus skrjabini miyazakii]